MEEAQLYQVEEILVVQAEHAQHQDNPALDLEDPACCQPNIQVQSQSGQGHFLPIQGVVVLA